MLGRLIAHLAIMCIIGLEIVFLCFMPTATNKQPSIHLTLYISAVLKNKKIFLHLLQGQIQLFGKKIFCVLFQVAYYCYSACIIK